MTCNHLGLERAKCEGAISWDPTGDTQFPTPCLNVLNYTAKVIQLAQKRFLTRARPNKELSTISKGASHSGTSRFSDRLGSTNEIVKSLIHGSALDSMLPS